MPVQEASLKNLRRAREIPVEPFRNAFIERYNKDEISLSEVAIALGRDRTETSYVQRMLGLRPYKTTPDIKGKGTGTSKSREGQRGWRYQVTMDYDTALKLADVLKLDYVEVGV